MTDEKKFSGWKRTYIGLLNAATVICIIIGCFIHIGGWVGKDIWNGVMGWNSGSGSERSSVAMAGDHSENTETFKKIKGEIAVGNVRLVKGDEYAVSYESYPEGEEPAYKVTDGVLKITQKTKKKNINSVNDIKNRFKGARIVITVPSGSEVEVDLAMNMGSIEIEDLTLEDVKLDADMGSIDIKDAKMEDLDINADMGGIDIEDCSFDEAEIKAQMGGIDVKDCDFSEMEADADMGGITVSGNYDKLKCDCDMGGINVSTGSGKNKLELSADMGGITVDGESVGRNYKN